MSNIQDIINAATPVPWKTSHCSNGGLILHRGTGMELQIYPSTDARFIETFDPAHVALMEDVCEAAEKVVSDCPFDFPTDCGDRCQCVYAGVCSALAWRDTYRKENGYA